MNSPLLEKSLEFVFSLIPILICAIFTTFSCGNFTCLPFYRRTKANWTKPFYFSIPSICVIISIGLLITGSIIEYESPISISYIFIPICCGFIYIMIVSLFSFLQLYCCQFRLMIEDIPLFSLLFSCWGRKSIEEALKIFKMIICVGAVILIPSFVFFVLLTLKLDGYIDISYSLMLCPLVFLLLGTMIFACIVQTACCVNNSILDSHDSIHNKLVEDSGSGNGSVFPYENNEIELDMLSTLRTPQVQRGKKINLPPK